MGLKRFLEKAGVELTHDKGLGLCLQESMLTIVSAYPKISKLSSFSSTVPQKGLLPRHQLELFFLFSVYFPFQRRMGIGRYGNSDFSKLILNFIRCSV